MTNDSEISNGENDVEAYPGQIKDRWRTWRTGTHAAALDTCGS